MKDGFELLKSSDLFNGLTERELLLVQKGMTKVLYRKGERIVKKGEFITHILFLIKGYVKIFADYKEKQVIINICAPNSFPGLGAMLEIQKHQFDIGALDDSILLLIDISLINNIIEQNGLFAKNVIQLLNNSYLHYINHNIVSLNQNNIHGRLAILLLHLSSNVFFSQHFDLLLSRKELSQFCNISRENVTKVLSEFNQEGIIRLNGKSIQILHPDRLKYYTEVG